MGRGNGRKLVQRALCTAQRKGRQEGRRVSQTMEFPNSKVCSIAGSGSVKPQISKQGHFRLPKPQAADSLGHFNLAHHQDS